MNEKTEDIIKKIIEKTEAKREEVINRINKKQEELSGFVTEEGAATIIARNYGITLEREEPEIKKLRIEDLSEGMSNIDVVGKVARIFEPNVFERQDGSKGKVANLTIIDKTGEIRVVLWDEMAELVARGELQKGMSIRFKNAYIKKGRTNSLELNVGKRSEIEAEPTGERVEDLPSLEDTKIKISDIDSNLEYADIVGRVIAVTNPREFERADGSKGKVATVRIADETGQIRVSIWDEKAEEVKGIEQGDIIKLENASVRKDKQDIPQLHVNWQSRLIRSPPKKEVGDLPEFERKLLKIEDIEPDMPTLDLAGKVQRTFPVNEFLRKDGSTGRVMNALIADETGTIRLSFWDNAAETAEKMSPGDLIFIENARSRAGLRGKPEIQIGEKSRIEINPENIEIGKTETNRFLISELEEGMDYIQVMGRIINMTEVREFTNSSGEKGKVASLTIGDKTGTCSVTLWGSRTELLDELEIGDSLKIENSYTVAGNYGRPEIHVGNLANVEINPEGVDLPPTSEINKKEPLTAERVKIENVKENSKVMVRGTVVKLFERKPFFSICPRCERSLGTDDSEALCEECGEIVEPDYRTVLNGIVDDGSSNIRMVLFGKLGEKVLGKSVDEIREEIKEGELSSFYKKIDLIGTELLVKGNIRHDDYFDMLEIRATEIDFPKPKEEAKRILKRIKA